MYFNEHRSCHPWTGSHKPFIKESENVKPPARTIMNSDIGSMYFYLLQMYPNVVNVYETYGKDTCNILSMDGTSGFSSVGVNLYVTMVKKSHL